MGIFENNIDALKHFNPSLTSQLSKLSSVSSFEVFMQSNEPKTLNLVHKTSFIPLYATQPAQEVEKQLETFSVFAKYPALYIFGLGNGALVDALLNNQQERCVIVIEPELEVLYVVLHLVDFSKAFFQKRLLLLSDTDATFSSLAPLLGALRLERFARIYDLHVNTAYYERYAEKIQAVNRVFIEVLHHNIQAVGNDTKDALIGLEHHMMNLPFMLTTPPLHQLLEGARKGAKTAVLVSTGPSLTKQLPLLKRVAPYVRIFAVDASFPVLHQWDIKPDVVVSMERVSLTGEFFKRTPREAFEGVVFALSSLQHPEVVGNIKAGTVQMSMRPFGYMKRSNAPLWGYAGIGMSAANMAYELIYFSKFETCVLIGQDLAYGDDGMSHAKGHTFGEDEVKQKEGDGYVERYGGGGVIKTSGVWKIFLSFFEKDVAQTQGKMKTINATEGGARIRGTIEMPFSEAISQNVGQTPKPDMVLASLKKSEYKKAVRMVEKSTQEMAAYIGQQKAEAEALFLEVATLCEALEEIEIKKLHEVHGRIVKFKARLKEPMFEDLVWFVAQTMLFVQELEVVALDTRIPKDESEEEALLRAYVMLHKGWLFALAGCIDAIEVALKRKGSHYEKALHGA